MITNRVVLVRLFAVCMIALAGLSPVARAATYTWDADAGTTGPQDGAGTWNTTLQNWWDGTQNIAWPDPNTADIAQFGAGSGAAGTVTVNAVQANGLTFAAAGSGNYTLSSGTITLGGSSPTITTNANATIQSVLAGSGFTKNGSSTLTFSGASANTYSGTTTINAGNLALSKNANVVAIPGDLVVNAGNVSYGASSNNQFASTSSLFVNNTATLNSGISNAFQTVANVTYNSSSSTESYLNNWTVTGTLAVGSGRISFASGRSGVFGAIQMTGGQLLTYAFTSNTTINVGSGGLSMTNAQIRYGDSVYNGAFTGKVVLGGNFTGSGTSRLWKGNTNQIAQLDLGNATRTFTITDGTTTIDTGVSVIGTGGLTKAGAGTLTLSGSNSYSGGTILSAGTLKLGSGGSFANSPL
ncbi:MAG: hypothetical protein RLZZ21_864, partial [Planctomycetota bacterium]